MHYSLILLEVIIIGGGSLFLSVHLLVFGYSLILYTISLLCQLLDSLQQ